MNINLLLRRDAQQANQNRSSNATEDERIYVNLHHLTLLQHRARGLTFLPRQPVSSLLSGRHASRVRGRGLNFEEIRQYHAGDDVRTIDWKVTARLRSPHSRVYTEERDRPVLLVIDQRLGMFFGSRVNMKSVTAAQAAALAAWTVIDGNDRVGAVLFNDQDLQVINPHRSRATVMRILKLIASFNRQLSATSSTTPNPGMLATVLERVSRLAKHDYLVVILSDFHGYDDSVYRHLRKIRQHNDFIAGLVHDPSASKLGMSHDFVITDGVLQVELKLGGKQTRERVQEASTGRIAEVLALQSKLQAPVFPLNTAEDTASQLQRLLGRGGKIIQQTGHKR